MSEFASSYSYRDFEKSVRDDARFIHTAEVRSFLGLIRKTSKPRARKIKIGTIFYRAQRGFENRVENTGEEDEFEIETALPPERMVPLSDKVGHGRANPKGIAYFYMATTSETAMAEVRPWLGSKVSLGYFKTMRECLIVDCSMETTHSTLLELDRIMRQSEEGEVATAEDNEKWVWGDIGYAFSKPVEINESELNYLPTQILAECFRNAGYDGIVYKSMLSRAGKNVVLFDLSAAELVSCCLFETKSIKFEFSQTESPYYVLKRYPEIAESFSE